MLKSSALVFVLLWVVGCKRDRPPDPLPNVPPIIALTVAQRAELGPPCVILADAVCSHLTDAGRPELCDRLELYRAQHDLNDRDCSFGLADGEAQRLFLEQIADGGQLDLSGLRRQLLNKRTGDPRWSSSTKLNHSSSECRAHDAWVPCLNARCLVEGRCAAGAGAGRCKPECQNRRADRATINPRGDRCELGPSAKSDGCLLLSVTAGMAPIVWMPLGNQRVGCASQGPSDCRPVADAKHPAGWRCEGTGGCSAWLESANGVPAGCRASVPDTGGRCVPFGTTSASLPVNCRDLDPPCGGCGIAFVSCRHMPSGRSGF